MATQPHSANVPVLVSVPFDADEFELVQQAAISTGASLSEFAHEAALQRAKEHAVSKPGHTREEVLDFIREMQQLMREANPEGRDLVAELIADRRAEAARE